MTEGDIALEGLDESRRPSGLVLKGTCNVRGRAVLASRIRKKRGSHAAASTPALKCCIYIASDEKAHFSLKNKQIAYLM
jgi:hypothetical protein